jgi:hypothetical protein
MIISYIMVSSIPHPHYGRVLSIEVGTTLHPCHGLYCLSRRFVLYIAVECLALSLVRHVPPSNNGSDARYGD